MKLFSLFIAAFSLIVGESTFAQSTPAPLRISGFVDTYYSKNFNQPASRTNKLRNFDFAENQFVVNLVEIDLQRKAEPVGFRLNAGFGTANDAVQAGSGSTTLPILQQAFLTAVLPVGSGLMVEAGKFVTHMGYEVFESKDNWNYSRSLLFAWAVPYYHTGLRLSYPAAENLTATLHVVNGWNSVVDNNADKTLGVTLNYVPIESTNIILNLISGTEGLVVSPILFETGKKNVVDWIIMHTFSDAFTLGINADYGEARTSLGLALWKGAAAYGRYVIDETSSVALRGEFFDDPQGYAAGAGIQRFDVKELTATYEYQFAESMLFRGEFRHDVANAPVFDTAAGAAPTASQSTILIDFITSF